MKKQISVIIPCYNERKNIQRCYNLVKEFLIRHNFEFEIIFVNDGSTDHSLEIIKKLSEGNYLLNYTSYKKNVGKGYAVFRGLNQAKYKTKLLLDCDLSININELYKLNWVWVINQYIIKGQRIQVEKQPLYRIFVGKVWKFITYIFTGIYMDTQAPFTILNFNKDFYTDLEINGFAFDVEILAKAKSMGFNIWQVSVEYRNDRESSVTFLKTMKMLSELRRIRKKYCGFKKDSMGSPQ